MKNGSKNTRFYSGRIYNIKDDGVLVVDPRLLMRTESFAKSVYFTERLRQLKLGQKKRDLN
jgi:hypothetical protein